MFAAGPAAIATRRRHVAAFQYASGPSPSRSSVSPFSADASAAARPSPRAAPPRGRRARRARLQVVAVERSLDAVDGPGERRVPPPPRARSDAPRRAGSVGACRGSSRSRRAGSPRCRTRSRFASSSRSRAGNRRRTSRSQADGERGEEVPRLVDEDEQREAEDRDEDAHTGANLRSVRRRASSSASTSSPRSRAGAPSTASERILDERRRSP